MCLTVYVAVDDVVRNPIFWVREQIRFKHVCSVSKTNSDVSSMTYRGPDKFKSPSRNKIMVGWGGGLGHCVANHIS